MKTIQVIVFVLAGVTLANAQSNSYQTLKNTFSNEAEVHSFAFSGWMGRMVLDMVGEHELKNAIKDLNHVRFITIPHSVFNDRNLSVKGFKKVLQQDSFEEIAYIRDRGEEVTIYLHETGNHQNRKNVYFVLVEEAQEVVAIELKGYLDRELLNSSTKLASNK
ncbi:MAG: DUF4252 domain-containing protein [Cyclobacteriaceae bacterium]|jgi:hypothetical protein|nr:DUF4252 domain-containing protein [Cyclobacteriaceae bacterium]